MTIWQPLLFVPPNGYAGVLFSIRKKAAIKQIEGWTIFLQAG